MPEALMAEPEAEREEDTLTFEAEEGVTPHRSDSEERLTPQEEQAFSEAETRIRDPKRRFAEAETRIQGPGSFEATRKFDRQLESPPEWNPRVERTPRFRETPQEKILGSHDVLREELLGGGENESHFIVLKDDGATVAKPVRGEAPGLREGIPSGTYFKRARAAYLISQFTRLDIVKPTVIREVEIEGKNVLASCQEYITDPKFGFELTKEQKEAARTQLIALWLFDYMIWNTDRIDKNLLFSGKEQTPRIFGIDNDLSFGKHLPRFHELLFTDEEVMSGEPAADLLLPSEITQAFDEAFGDMATIYNVHELLEELLPPQEVEACFLRMERVRRWLSQGMIPGKELDSFHGMERVRRHFWIKINEMPLEVANEAMVGYRGDRE